MSGLVFHTITFAAVLEQLECILHPTTGLMYLEFNQGHVASRDYDFQKLRIPYGSIDGIDVDWVSIRPSILRDVSQELIHEFNKRIDQVMGDDNDYYIPPPPGAMGNRIISWTTVHCVDPYGEGHCALPFWEAVGNLIEDALCCFIYETDSTPTMHGLYNSTVIRTTTYNDQVKLRQAFRAWWRKQACGPDGISVTAQSSLTPIQGCVPDLRR
jgi:hypothetical protein